MATIVTRSGKGSPLTNNEVDANFNNLNSGKAELSGATFTGVVTVIDGSTSAPSVTNAGDTNTGIYFDGADSVAFTAGGTTRGAFNSGGLQVVGALSATGVLTANAGVKVDNFTLDGTTLALSSGSMVLNASGNNQDILFNGNAGGSPITALTLDMSAGGIGIFRSQIKTGNMSISGQEIDVSSGNLTLDVAGGITLDADGGQVDFKDGGALKALIDFSGNNVEIQSRVTDGDILFRGQDGGSFITALTLDMSAAGAATFNAGATFSASVGIVASGAPAFSIQDSDGTNQLGTIGHNGGETSFTSRNNTGNGSFKFYTHDGSTFTDRFNIASSGTATFSSKISVGGALKVSGQNTVHSTNSLVLGQEGSGVAQLRAYGPNGTTKGQFQFAVSANDGSPSTVALAIAADSSATFSAGILTNAEVKVTSTGVDGNYAPILRGVYSGNANETNSIETTVSSVAGNSGFKFNVSNGGGSAGQTEALRITRGGTYAPLGMRIGAGTGAIDGTLHVHTASAGTVAASSQADDLVIENGAEGGMTIITPNDQSARIRFTSPATNNDVGGATIFYRQNINKMLIGTAVSGGVLALASGAGNESMVLDASGFAIFGGTAQGAQNALTISQAGYVQARVTGTAGYFDRLGSDGAILQFRKGGADTGSIGTPHTGELFIGGDGANSSGLLFTSGNTIQPRKNNAADNGNISLGTSGNRFKDIHASGTVHSDKVLAENIYRSGTNGSGLHFTTNATIPTNQDAAVSNGTEDLGHPSYRFKDLYLSGGIHLGGTGAPNKLDDYEEGTWTPTMRNDSTNIGITINGATYVKIGRLVHISGRVTRNDGNNYTGTLTGGGLPFITAPNYVANNGGAWFDKTGTDVVTQIHFSLNTSLFYFKLQAGLYPTSTALQNGRPVYFSGFYETNL